VNADSFATKIADKPVTARKAYIVKPIPCPIPVRTPCERPPEIVFLRTTAKLGPGDIAPNAQTNDMPSSAVKSIINPA
jgi:hypothetical protein